MSKATQPIILMSREQSSMVSTWNEMLGATKLSNGKWRIDTYGHEILGSIYELIPEAELYDENDELKIPKVWKGQKIFGLADGEYLETYNLFCNEDGVAFDSADLKVALDWCKHERWDRHPDFPKAWKELSAMVSPQPK